MYYTSPNTEQLNQHARNKPHDYHSIVRRTFLRTCPMKTHIPVPSLSWQSSVESDYFALLKAKLIRVGTRVEDLWPALEEQLDGVRALRPRNRSFSKCFDGRKFSRESLNVDKWQRIATRKSTDKSLALRDRLFSVYLMRSRSFSRASGRSSASPSIIVFVNHLSTEVLGRTFMSMSPAFQNLS